MKLLKRLLKNKKRLFFIDFEGTQFTHEIIATGIYMVEIDEEGNIINEPNDGLLIYTKPRSPIGGIVTKMTTITEEFIKENGISWKDTITKIQEYIGENIDDALFVCFGNNDPRMIIESCRYSHPENSSIAKEWVHHFIDLLSFISQFIKDEKGCNYSLVNYLKLFSVEPVGISHNPLNDAKDLKNLYKAFIDDKEVVFQEYLKLLNKMKIFPEPVNETLKKLIDGQTVTSEDFFNDVKKYLS